MITDKEPAERLTEEQKLMAPENPYHQHILTADDGDGFTYRHAHIEHFLPHTHETSEVRRQLNAGELRLWPCGGRGASEGREST